MAIVLEDVITHCDRLQAKGEKVNLKNLRESIGRGSMSTLGPLLKQWKDLQREKENQTDAVAVPQTLITAITSAVGSTISDVVNQKTAELQDKLQTQEDDYSTVLNELTETTTAHQELKQAYEALKDENSTIRGNLKAVTKQIEDQKKDLADKDKELEALRSSYSSSEQLHADNDELQRKTSALENEVTRLTTLLEEKEKTLGENANKIGQLEEDLREQAKEANRCHDLQKTIEEKNTEISALKKDLEQKNSDVLRLTEEKATALGQAQNAEKRNAELQTQISQLDQSTSLKIIQSLETTSQRLFDAFGSKLSSSIEQQNRAEKKNSAPDNSRREKPAVQESDTDGRTSENVSDLQKIDVTDVDGRNTIHKASPDTDAKVQKQKKAI